MKTSKPNTAVACALFLMYCSPVCALNPALNINQYGHRSWTVRDGFFRGAVNTIAQTPDGYLWLGTESGLYRFDGVRSVPWQLASEKAFPSNVIGQAFVSKDGALWIGTLKGPARWSNSKLDWYPSLNGQAVDSFAEDSQGAVWIGLETPPDWRLCAIKARTVQCFGDNGTLGLGVGTLLSDSKGNLWAGTGTGLWRWRNGAPESIPLPGPASEIHKLIEDQDGSVLASTRAGIERILDGSISPYRLPDYDVQFVPFGLLRDRGGSLWIGTRDRGLLHVHQGSTDHFGISNGLSSDFIEDLFEDREGNIWVATANGLDCFHDSVAYPLSVKPGVFVPGVESVLTAADGSVWLGTRNGLDRWQDGRLTLYRKNPAESASTFRRIIDPGLPDDLQGSVFEDHSGRIWVFSPAGAAWLDERGRFQPVPHFPGGFAHAIAEDNAGDLWISQDQGLFHLLRGGQLEQIPWSLFGGHGLALAVVSDPSRTGLWLGFSKGSVAYFSDGQVRRWYSTADGVGSGRVYNLHFEENGTLWVETEGGLTRLTANGIHTLNTQNGLPCDSVYDLVTDNAQSMWLGTACGLVRITSADREAWVGNSKLKIQTTLLENSDGFTPLGMPLGLTPRMTKPMDGKIWLVTRDSVTVVDPQQLSNNRIPPPVHIERIVADDKPYDLKPGMRLPPNVRNLRIEFTALSLVTPEKIHFRYKLEGQNQDWHEVINERQATYTNLPPRNHRFRVIASNNSGVWNETGDTLEFSIAPAYWQTNWFRVSLAAVFFLVLWGTYRLRLHQIAREFNAHLEGRVDERLRVARNLHDTLLQTVQGLMLRLQVVAEMLPPGKAKEELEQTMEVGDQAIVEGRNTVNDLRATVITSRLATAIQALGEELGAGNRISFRLVLEGQPRDLNPLVRDELYRIAREALRNAFAHARAQQIAVEITYDDKLLRLRIRDDGQGIPPKILKEGRSGHFGLAGMRERAKEIGCKLTISSAVGAGTEIELTVPGSIVYAKHSTRSRFALFRGKAGVSR